MKSPYSTSILEDTLNKIQSWIKAADQKISILLGLQGVTITLLTKEIIDWIRINDLTLNSPVLFSISIGSFCVGYSIFLCVKALTPSIKRNGRKKSLLFFGDISSISLTEYKDSVVKTTKSEYYDDLLEQIHTNSEIAMLKYTNFKHSIYFFVLGALILISMYIIYSLIKIYAK